VEDSERQELIKKLAESRDSIVILENMFKKEQWNVGQKLEIIGDTKRNLNDVLYELTGNKFYLNKEGE